MSRGDLTDAEWRILNPLLPDRGERGPPIPEKRRTANGILWVLRTGAPWRDMPERYGKFGLCALHTLEQADRVRRGASAWPAMGRRPSQLCPPYATPSSNSSLHYRRSDARIVENGFATSGGLSNTKSH